MRCVGAPVTPLVLALLVCTSPPLKCHGAASAELKVAAQPPPGARPRRPRGGAARAGVVPSKLFRRLPSIPARPAGSQRRGRPHPRSGGPAGIAGLAVVGQRLDARLTAFWRGAACGADAAGAEQNVAWCGGGRHPVECNRSVDVPSTVCPQGRASLRSLAGDGTAAGQATVAGCSYFFFSQYQCEGNPIGETAMMEAQPTFTDLDCVERDGVVTEDEAATWSAKNGVPYGELRELLKQWDADGSRTISKQEFESRQPLSGRLLAGLSATFESVDRDGSRSISRHEWLTYCSGWMTPKPEPETCAELFNSALTSGADDELSREEFEASRQQAVAA